MAGAGQTIAIIDDDESVRRAMRRLLGSTGLNVETFGSAEEFVRAPREPAPSGLILDVRLPGLSGIELQQQLIAEQRNLPIIFISAYADDSMRAQALQAGAVAFLQKPFDEHALLDAVARALA